MTDDELKGLLGAIREDVAGIRENGATRQDLEAVRQEIAAVRENGATRHDLEAVRQEIAAVRENAATRRDLQAVRQEIAAVRENAATRQDLEAVRADIAAAHVETRRYFDVAVEAFKHEVRLVAEAVAHTRAELVRTATQLDEKFERIATETQAMIKFSHAELDRRMRTLEETQSRLEDALEDLQSRVERLERPTH